MRKQDFEFLVELIRNNAGWEFDEEQYFIIDKKISNFIREKGYTSTGWCTNYKTVWFLNNAVSKGRKQYK